MKADRDRIIDELAALVRVPSVTGDERPVQDLVAGLMERDGLRVERIEPDLGLLVGDPEFPGMEVEREELPLVAGFLDSGRPGPRTLLMGHVDVVPPGEPDTWTAPAFEPEVRDGELYGRGACDMKGGIVAILEALRLVGAGSDDLCGEIVAVSVPSEEDGGAGAFAAVKAGLVGDACVITEPTRLDIVTAHAGAITFTLDIPGKAAHASMRREGVSALERLAYLMDALAADERRRNDAEAHPLMRAIGLPYPTIIGQVEGGNWASTVPDRMVAHGRYGVRLGQDGLGAADELRRAIATACTEDDWLRDHPAVVTVWGGRYDSASVAEDHPLPVGLAAAHRRVTGSGTSMVGAPYGADMRLLINQGRTPTVMYGPGDVRVAHAADEHVSLDEIATCAEVLAAWLQDVHRLPS